MSKVKKYDLEYKIEAVKLAKEIGVKKACDELNVPYGTLYDWIKAERKGIIDIRETRTPKEAMSLAEEIQRLRKENKEQAKEIKRLTELNEFL